LNSSNSIGKIYENVAIGDEELSAENLAKLQEEINEHLAKLANAEADRPQAHKEVIDIAKKVNDQIRQVIIPNQKEAREKMRGIQNKFEGEQAKALGREKIKKALESYDYVKKEIQKVSFR
jgi:predicted naringenin-chalcone synthase